MRFMESILAVSVGMSLGLRVALADPAPTDPNMPPPPPSDKPSPSGVTPPRADGPHRVDAFYPPLARRLDEQGSVGVNFTVTENGTVDNPTMFKSSGFADLDNAALEAVRSWRYKPAMKDGKAVAVSSGAFVKFELTNPDGAPVTSSNTRNSPYEEMTMSISDYPQESIAAKETGRTVVLVDLADDGSIASAAVVRSSGFARLDEASLAIAKTRWHFTAAMRDGKPMMSATFFVFNWLLPTSGGTNENH